MILGIVAILAFNLVDTFFIGMLGTEALAAISFTFPVTFVVTSLAMGLGAGLSAVIGEGRRAITVKVNEVIGVAGFALPGNYVDVLVNLRDDREAAVSKIILEHILVLAVAQEKRRDESKPRVVNAVTLEATPEQAEKLDLARSIGTLSLVLRNQIDRSPVQTVGMRRADLMAAAPAATPPRPPAPPRRPLTTAAPAGARIEVIRGIQKSGVDFT